MDLAEELLLKVFEIVNNWHKPSSKSLLRYDPNPLASHDMRALSLVNHRFRRIALPFVFSVIKRRKVEDFFELLDGIKAGMIRFHIHIRTIVIGDRRSPKLVVTTEQTAEAFASSLPLLSSLRLMVLCNTSLKSELLTAVNSHHSLEFVQLQVPPDEAIDALVTSMRPIMMHKVQLMHLENGESAVAFLKGPLERGLRISELSSSLPTGLFPIIGLRFMNVVSFGSTKPHSWFQQLLEQNPLLEEVHVLITRELKALTGGQWTIPFSSTALKLPSLSPGITSLGLVRDTSSVDAATNADTTFANSKWTIRTCGVQCTDPLAYLRSDLASASSAFPNLTKLTLDFSDLSPVYWLEHWWLTENLVDEVAFSFPALEEIELKYVGGLLRLSDPDWAIVAVPTMNLLVENFAERLAFLHTAVLNASETFDADDLDRPLFFVYEIRDKLLVDGRGVEISSWARTGRF